MSLSPILRFPKYNNSWRRVKLGEIVETFSGGTPTTSITKYYNGDIPFIKSAEINSVATEQFISKEGLENSSAKMVERGDLLVALYGANSGETGIARIDGAINQAVLCIRSKEDKYFIKFFLDFKKERILSTYLQGGQGNLSAALIKDLEIVIPEYEEQRQISSFFALLDQKIEKQQEKIEQLELFKKGMLQKIFSQEIRFKDENGQDFPEWDSELFEQVATNNSNKIIPQSKTNVPCIELENIVGNRGRINGFYLSQEQQSTKNEFAKGSVLFGKLRPYLKKYWYATFDGICSSEIWVLTSKSPRITNEFLYFIIQSDTFQQAANISSGSKMPRTEWDSIRSLEIPLPSIEEQKKIASFLFTLEEKISKEESKFESLIQLKNGLLQQMFV